MHRDSTDHIDVQYFPMIGIESTRKLAKFIPHAHDGHTIQLTKGERYDQLFIIYRSGDLKCIQDMRSKLLRPDTILNGIRQTWKTCAATIWGSEIDKKWFILRFMSRELTVVTKFNTKILSKSCLLSHYEQRFCLNSNYLIAASDAWDTLKRLWI